jgi:hypothetical protein
MQKFQEHSSSLGRFAGCGTTLFEGVRKLARETATVLISDSHAGRAFAGGKVCD